MALMESDMNGLIIGFDLCDSYTQIAVYDEEKKDVACVSLTEKTGDIPTTICKCRRKDEWKIGEAACEMALLGAGIVVDKLLRLVKKDGQATLENRTYKASELLEIYIKEALGIVSGKLHKDVMRIVFTVNSLDRILLDEIMNSAKNLGYSEDKVTIISHSESFLYYLLRQNTENFANMATAFDLSKEGLTYYECMVQRGVNPQIARVAEKSLDGFSMDILENDAGKKLADTIFSKCVDSQYGCKIISSAYLTGRGLADIQEWGNKSLTRLCCRRKVYLEEGLFARGAVWMGVSEELSDEVKYPYTFIGEGRILADVSMNMRVKGVNKTLMLLEAGERWYSKRGSVEFIIDSSDDVCLQVTPAGEKKPVDVRIPLGELPNRPNKTSRVRLDARFLSESRLLVTITDLGFGELFPSDGCVIEREITL